jgi:glycerophosphoryl diester phosphodiesterase
VSKAYVGTIRQSEATVLALSLIALTNVTAQPVVTLTGFAVLPADTLAAGPPSGAWRDPASPGVPQFRSQPVQGVSSLWPAGGDEWWALADNGYGVKTNSSDFLLRIYRLRVGWRDGMVTPLAHVQFADPDRQLPFPIARETTPERWLTGADLDPESMVLTADGSFWIGDEFGPFLLHFASDGRLLERPFEVPQLRSPDHPHVLPADAGERSTATARRSRGFEGLATFGGQLYALLEAGVGSDAAAAVIYEFDIATRAFTGQSWRVPLSTPGNAMTEFVSLASLGPLCASRFLAIERDDGQGPTARTKRVLEIHLAGNSVAASVVVDLLRIANPDKLGGHSVDFSFPFITTESVWPLSRHELVLANDNNYPAGGGRPGSPRDATEFIRLRLTAPLCDR